MDVSEHARSLGSGGNTQVKAVGNLSAQSLQLSAGGDAALGAAGAVAITSGQAYSSTVTGSDKKQSLQTERSQIEAGGKVTIYGAQSVTLSASDVDAGGKALVQSQGDVELGYNTDTDQHNWCHVRVSATVLLLNFNPCFFKDQPLDAGS